MSRSPIDIVEELVEISRNERVLALLELEVERGASPPISGLCKVSTAKEPGGKMPYLSLAILADTPDDDAKRVLDAALAALGGEAFRNALSPATDVVLAPLSTRNVEQTTKQIDVLFAEGDDPGTPFVEERLLPSLERLTPLRVRDVVWWERETEEAKPGAGATEAAAETPLGRLRGRLKRLLGGGV